MSEPQFRQWGKRGRKRIWRGNSSIPAWMCDSGVLKPLVAAPLRKGCRALRAAWSPQTQPCPAVSDPVGVLRGEGEKGVLRGEHEQGGRETLSPGNSDTRDYGSEMSAEVTDNGSHSGEDKADKRDLRSQSTRGCEAAPAG